MDLSLDTSKERARSRHPDCSAAVFSSRVNGIARLVSLLAVFVALMSASISYAAPLMSSEDDPSQALSTLWGGDPSSSDGYVSTSFTPPWSATDPLTIFASSTTHTGNLGGLEGARVICQNLANAQQALQGTTWYPILSDSTWDASSLTGNSSLPSPVYRIDGTVLASSRAALWSGSGLSAAVLKTETGAIRYDAVYTGTNSTGGKGSFHCSNWSSTSGNGLLGATTETSTGWITGPLTGCGVPYRIYCIGNYNPFGANPTITPSPVSSNTPTITPTPTATFTSIPTITATPASSFTPTLTPTSTPLSTATPTPTSIPGTPTATPAVSTLSFKVVIASTPVPSLPVSVGGSIFNTDTNGMLSTTASSSSSVTVQTGLPAVAFTPFTDIANRFNGRTVEIEATRLINPLPNICSILVGNQLNVFFPYENTSGVALSVPLSLYRLNRILSPSGIAPPANLFAPGLQGNGFTLPISHFQTGNSLSGTWEFLATSVTVPSTLTTCSAQGNPNPTPSPTPAPPQACTPFDFAVIFIEAKRTVTNLSEESLKAAARKEWNPTGNLKDPFLNSGALALNKLIAIIKRTGRTLYTCSTPPPTSSCIEKTINKSEITNAFNLIFPKTLPTGLARVKKRIPIEKNRYAQVLAKIPRKAYSCR